MNKLKFYKIIILFLLVIAVLNIGLIFTHSDNLLHVYFFNVGQGDSILIKGPEGQKILIDGGPDNTVLSELGKKLDFYERDIDLIILTHPDSDHITGLLSILERYNVKQILFSGLEDNSSEYQILNRIINQRKISTSLAKEGQIIKIRDNIKIDVLYPGNYLINKKILNTNDSSLLLKLKDKNISFLFTGDAEQETEDYFLRHNKDIDSDILKVSHHGSKNGFGEKEGLLEKINPSLAIISVGRNKYGHPDKTILDLLNNRKIKVLRTDQQGTIEIISNGENYQLLTEK